MIAGATGTPTDASGTRAVNCVLGGWLGVYRTGPTTPRRAPARDRPPPDRRVEMVRLGDG
ncbi:hypothetical protein BH23PLA1_BH23PLA1_44680 [soil metagenome]